MTCADCGAPTEIISRRIGFFGKVDTYSRFCRSCLPSHADEGGYTPEEALVIYDACVDAVKRAQAARTQKGKAS